MKIMKFQSVLLCGTTIFLLISIGVVWAQHKFRIATYEDVKGVKDRPDTFLIDVRTRSEVAEIGQIPHSFIVPLDEFKNALSTNTSADDFKRKYGHNKPGLNDRIITTCRSGRRARLATRMAEELGYTNVYTYKGSWLDWEKHEKELSNSS